MTNQVNMRLKQPCDPDFQAKANLIISQIKYNPNIKGWQLAKHFNTDSQTIRKYIQLIRESSTFYLGTKKYIIATKNGYLLTRKKELIQKQLTKVHEIAQGMLLQVHEGWKVLGKVDDDNLLKHMEE